MKKTVLLFVAAAFAFGTTAVTASAQPELPKSPKKACEWLAANEPDFYAFIATKPGACESTIASVGLEALMNGAFPSIAAAVGNCKALEQSDFMAFTPEDGRPYPYQFYWWVPGALIELEQAGFITEDQLAWALDYYASISDQLYAKNRAGCITVLQRLHPEGGVIAPLFALFPPME